MRAIGWVSVPSKADSAPPKPHLACKMSPELQSQAATGRAELPLLSTVVSTFAESHDWKQAFVAMLRGVAAARGETLPELPAG